jgi:phosphatidate cytidylyltransferase
MNELITRALSGLLYALIIVITLFIPKEWFFVVFFILGSLTIFEFLKLIKIKSWIPYLLLISLFFIFNFTHIKPVVLVLFLIPTLIVNSILIVDLFTDIDLFSGTNSQKKQLKRKYACIVFYLISGIIFLTQIPFVYNYFNPALLVSIFVLIWANDTFAYLIGKNFGKNKLMPTISPKKTIEGFIGGMLGTIFISYFVFLNTRLFSILIWVVLAILIAILGTIGDLVQSKFKRQAGVKDSGKIMPGHGGLYDRLDSILFTSPFIYIFLELFYYVS